MPPCSLPRSSRTFEPRAFANAWRATLEGDQSGDGVLLVACAGEQVVGFAAVGASGDGDADAGTAELLVLGVHPEARRQGHGSRLLHAVVDTTRGRGRSELAAWVLAGDDATRGFLTAAGMVADGAHRERVVSQDGGTTGEIRLSAAVVDGEDGGTRSRRDLGARLRHGRPGGAAHGRAPGLSWASRPAPTASASGRSPSRPGSTRGRPWPCRC